MRTKAMNDHKLVYRRLTSREESVTAEAQRAALERYAQLHGFTIMVCGLPEASDSGNSLGDSAAWQDEASDQ